VSGTDLFLRRVLKAPRRIVWDCWTRPEHLCAWFCPRPHRVTEAFVDLRPGGRFGFVLSVDGNLNRHENSYLEIDEGRRLVFTDLMTAGWQPVERPFLGYTAEVTLEDHAEGTLYLAHARHKTGEAARRHDAMGFTEGWGLCADQLEALAVSLEAV
jgi:uncharacterized protein YndB with AHSA1/START domain